MQDYFSQTSRSAGLRWAVAAAAIAALVLQGCASLPGSSSPEAPPARCDAAVARSAVGRNFGPELERDLRARSGASTVRLLSPGQEISKELNPRRLNLTLDGRGQVVQASCG